MKRIKKVFTNHEAVLHLWANRAQEDARCKNVYFDGNSCYSYGSHYELGRLIQFNGQTVALINDSGYSNTTNKHIHSAYWATKHFIHLKTHEIDDGVETAMIRLQGEIIESCFNHFNGLKFWEKYSFRSEYSPRKKITQFNEYCDKLNLKHLKLDLNDAFVECFNDHIKTRIFKGRAKKAEADRIFNLPENVAKRAEEQRLLDLKNAETIAEWRDGKSNSLPWNIKTNGELLRINKNKVETSRGADVPLKNALKLLELIEQGKARKGMKCGAYTLEKVLKTYVEIGCHTIMLSEARAVLGSLPRLSLVGGAQ